MVRIPKGRLVENPYKPICRDCAMYFSNNYCILYIIIKKWLPSPCWPPKKIQRKSKWHFVKGRLVEGGEHLEIGSEKILQNRDDMYTP